MIDLAFESEELALSDTEKASARNLAKFGRTTKEALLRCIERHGPVDGVIEAALLLPLAEYHEVVKAWERAPTKKKGRK